MDNNIPETTEEEYKTDELGDDREEDSPFLPYDNDDYDPEAYKVGNSLMLTSFLEEDFGRQHELYTAYEDAMQRQNQTPREERTFCYDWFDYRRSDLCMFGNFDDGDILGALDSETNIFEPEVFIPLSLPGGYKLLKSLGEDRETPTALATSENIEQTFKKMPCWHSLDELGEELTSSLPENVDLQGIVINDCLFGLGAEKVARYINGLIEKSQPTKKDSDAENDIDWTDRFLDPFRPLKDDPYNYEDEDLSEHEISEEPQQELDNLIHIGNLIGYLSPSPDSAYFDGVPSEEQK